MKIAVIGLGLIGASYAEKLKDVNEVFGFDSNQNVLNEAIKDGVIKDAIKPSELARMDLVILALYPKDNIEFIKKNHHYLDHLVLTDVSGTKAYMIEQIKPFVNETVAYISMHPMAGKEVSGYYHRNKNMFKGANVIIVPVMHINKYANACLDDVIKTLGFKNKIETDAKTHDDLIAFTSQLTHLIAVSLVNADPFLETKSATGDSYRDLTRIAKINETMWTELFLENKASLLEQITLFEKELQVAKDLIIKDDEQAIKAYLKKAKEKRVTFDEN